MPPPPRGSAQCSYWPCFARPIRPWSNRPEGRVRASAAPRPAPTPPQPRRGRRQIAHTTSLASRPPPHGTTPRDVTVHRNRKRESRSPGHRLMSKARTTRAGNGLTPGKASRPIDTMAERGNHPRPGRVGRRRRDVRTPWSPGLRVVRGGVRARRDRGRLQAPRPSSHSTITTPRRLGCRRRVRRADDFLRAPSGHRRLRMTRDRSAPGRAPGVVPGSVARITD